MDTSLTPFDVDTRSAKSVFGAETIWRHYPLPPPPRRHSAGSEPGDSQSDIVIADQANASQQALQPRLAWVARAARAKRLPLIECLIAALAASSDRKTEFLPISAPEDESEEMTE